MNEIKLLELTLRNFKGIRQFTLSPNGLNANVYGDNATGKTTLMDAFLWLLFDKDSQNNSNFNIKTLDQDGNVIHGLEHEVTAKLSIDGKVVELQKIYKEKWTKKRGEAERTLTGHITDYYINGVPKKKTEYESYLNNIIDENTFRILTNPLYFNTSLHWKQRRALALKICGEVEPEDIFRKNSNLIELKPLLADKTVDELKAEMTARKRKLNEELKSIPYRIDELSREKVEFDIEALTKEKKELEAKLIGLKNSNGIDYCFRLRAINGGIKVLENEMKELEQNLTKEIREQLNAAMEAKSNIQRAYYEVKGKAESWKARIDVTKEKIETLNKELEDLRNKFKGIAAETFDESTTICPTCKRPLPDEEIERHKAEFENYKSNTLAEINAQGKSIKAELDKVIKDLANYEKELENNQQELIALTKFINSKENEIKALEEELQSIDITKLPEYREIQSKLEKLNEEKKEVEVLAKEQENSSQILELEARISEINKQLARVDLAKENEKRIEELKDRERMLAQMVAETEKIEYLCDQYVITQAKLLEDKLNSKFKTVKFKLFDIQVNGGINETFVTTVDGVPFEDLNNAMKINAGLDIINTLTDYYNVKAPIFIDNRESVNEIIDVKSQVINLIVSKDKELRVEVW